MAHIVWENVALFKEGEKHLSVIQRLKLSKILNVVQVLFIDGL